ncbi:MAG: hypothetical protein Ct9H300mP21_01940 [Pseudomonadota bacterium]|nr:MAG: hypothetical protein Ct9H300mP21_01940 [Pseudomonadota bacterium]
MILLSLFMKIKILRLRSLTEDYEWMTFFENDFSILDASSYLKNQDLP